MTIRVKKSAVLGRPLIATIEKWKQLSLPK